MLEDDEKNEEFIEALFRLLEEKEMIPRYLEEHCNSQTEQKYEYYRRAVKAEDQVSKMYRLLLATVLTLARDHGIVISAAHDLIASGNEYTLLIENEDTDGQFQRIKAVKKEDMISP